MVVGEFCDLVAAEDRDSMQIDDQPRSSLNVSATQANESALKQTFNPAMILKNGNHVLHENGELNFALLEDTNSV